MAKRNTKALLTLPTLKQKTYLHLYLLMSFYVEDYKSRMVEALNKLKKGLAQESDQTKEMLDIYLRQTQGQASKEELKIAHQQFCDILKGVGLSALLVLPFSPIALPLFVKIGEKLGINILPDSFHD